MMQAQDFPLISHSPKRWAAFAQSRTPILESIVPLDARGLRSWKEMGGDVLAAHVKWKVADLGIGSRSELERRDSGLYAIVCKCGLIGAIGLKSKNAGDRNWAQMGDEEIIALAERIIDEQGFGGRTALERHDRGLYRVLSSRELLTRLPFPQPTETQDWIGMSDEELVSMAKEKIKDEGITSRYGFSISHKNLYDALRRRALLDSIGLRSSKEGVKDWTVFDDGQLLSLTRDFIVEKGIQTRAELRESEGGNALYKALRRRCLLNEIDFPKERGQWRRMGDEQLVDLARKVFLTKDPGNRRGIRGINPSLHDALHRRGLIEEVFSDVDSLKHKEAIDGVLKSLESFGDEK